MYTWTRIAAVYVHAIEGRKKLSRKRKIACARGFSRASVCLIMVGFIREEGEGVHPAEDVQKLRKLGDSRTTQS
jgi:hypothetical protein